MLHLHFVPFFFADGASGAPSGDSPAAGETQGVTQEAAIPAEEPVAQKTYTEEELQSIIQKRVAKLKNVEKELSDTKAAMQSHQSLLDKLSLKYGTEADAQKISEAIDNSRDFIEDFADKKGMSIDAAKEFVKLQLDSMSQKRAAQAEQEAQKAAQENAQMEERRAKLENEANQVKAVYPTFDLVAEYENPIFKSMLHNGVDMRSAYEATHYKELQQNAVRVASEGTEKAITDNIRAKGNRPRENGASNNSGFTATNDVNTMTSKEFAEYRKLVESGKIKLGR